MSFREVAAPVTPFNQLPKGVHRDQNWTTFIHQNPLFSTENHFEVYKPQESQQEEIKAKIIPVLGVGLGPPWSFSALGLPVQRSPEWGIFGVFPA